MQAGGDLDYFPMVEKLRDFRQDPKRQYLGPASLFVEKDCTVKYHRRWIGVPNKKMQYKRRDARIEREDLCTVFEEGA